MPFIKTTCPTCGKTAESAAEFTIGNKIVQRLKCNHIFTKEQLGHVAPENIVSLDGKRLYAFQADGVRFVENSGGRCLISDEMGLGKTVQALGTLALHKELCPFLAIVKSSLKTQWQHEVMRWMGEDSLCQVIDGARDFFLHGMTGYIISYDLIRRFMESDKTSKRQPKSTLPEIIERMRIKTIILDECQQIKNTESQRTQHVRELCKHVDNVIALSGTPIKNNAAEYFPVLNILKPEIYPRYSTFLMNECDSYYNGFGYKTGGLRNPERFLEKTKSFIIRRERKDVLPDLPPIIRNFQFCDLSKEVEKAYIQEFINFRDEYNSGTDDSQNFEDTSNTLARLSRMRHLTGLSKIDPCIDYVMEIMGSTEDRVCIFVHHNDVAEILTIKLNRLMKELNFPEVARHAAGSQSHETEKAFKESRILICSTLAGGEGLNLQHLCFRFIMLERQWNPANEEQAEARFPRPEGLKVNSIDGTYFVAVGTVDELFAEIIERKRELVSKTLSGKAASWDQSSLIKELCEVLANSGGKKWSV